MCGIVGYVGTQSAKQVIFDGLKSLEYRGYDSAGIALLENGGETFSTTHIKRPGKLSQLENDLHNLNDEGTIGIGHTRWATHGEPNESNSHPHRYGAITIVHNGIIENHGELRKSLDGEKFTSETDSEIFAHLVEKQRANGKDLLEAVRLSFSTLDGNSAFLVMDENSPDEIVAVRKGASPLVVGLGEGESFVASDIPALLKHTRDVYYLKEDELVVLTRKEIKVFDLDGKELPMKTVHIDWDADTIDKKGYPHFMLKEIHEQPQALRDTFMPWLDRKAGKLKIRVEGMTEAETVAKFKATTNLRIIACGTAFNACMYGQNVMERVAGIPASCELAHEFRYRQPCLRSTDVGIIVSQSGETADAIAAMKLMQSNGMSVFCITNTRGSSLARDCDGVFLMNAGIEVCVASTKAYCTMLGMFALLGASMGVATGRIKPKEEAQWVEGLDQLPNRIEESLKEEESVRTIAEKYLNMKGYLYVGRGVYFGIALEGALKLKELAYVHAEGFAGGELKHGPIALVEKNMLIVAIAPEGEGELHKKSLSNVQEVKARKGTILGIGRNDDTEFRSLSDLYFGIPENSLPDLYPILCLVPLQFLAYFISVRLGCDVDQPRNLAKSVTVE